MLELLHIENIAIIERADILFGRGFNALTGETGAGKSIVIDALGAVLGQRTSRELIRTGAEKAFVSATFSAVPADLPGLAENGFTPEEDGTQYPRPARRTAVTRRRAAPCLPRPLWPRGK